MVSGRLAWMETLPPLIIIAGAVAAMGGLQSLSQWATVGKPKAVGVDPWDRQVEWRDRQLRRNPEDFSAAWGDQVKR